MHTSFNRVSKHLPSLARTLLSTTLHSHLWFYEVCHSFILTLKLICRNRWHHHPYLEIISKSEWRHHPQLHLFIYFHFFHWKYKHISLYTHISQVFLSNGQNITIADTYIQIAFTFTYIIFTLYSTTHVLQSTTIQFFILNSLKWIIWTIKF